MELRRSHRSRGTHDNPEPEANMRTRSTRRTRASASATVSVSRSPLNSEEPKSLRLTVKMPSNKLREATGSGRGAARRSVNVFREDPIVSGPRSSRNRKKIVEVESSDDDDIDDQEEDEVDDDDVHDDDEDADADADADGDIDMDDTPPQPAIRRGKVAPTRAKPPKSVEAKEMEMEDEEEEEEDEEEEPISDTDEDAEGEVDDQDELAIADADANIDDLDDLDDEELDGDMDSDAFGVQGGKTTKRQRGNLGNDFLQLPMEPQVKKHLTAEERQMRRAEMARRRKNLSEKRNEEEKMDTINRLLKKQAPKRRGRAAANEAGDGTPGQETTEPEKAESTLARWTSGANGCSVSVPEEWLGTPTGRVFGAPIPTTGKMVEEV
ncbi:unnamed protein product [Penicillium salamii]|uniref:INO80 complex subunit B-like conserved region domain-containing protein n=1 Tax=Penicillium salamii TaxID=1612424 RepID=A0A9W4JXF7_9EURO|nr:unnamed protein product [Penicillium salamii]